MSAGVDLLFDEFAASYARGEHPDARDYLERAGDARDALADLIDRFLAAAPVQPPGEETLVLFARSSPKPRRGDAAAAPRRARAPRLTARRGRRLDPRAVRARRGEAGEGRALLPRARDGAARPRAVISERLREALSERFGDALQAALTCETPPLGVDLAYRRVQDEPARYLASFEEIAPAEPAPPERDEVDRLFVGDRQSRKGYLESAARFGAAADDIRGSARARRPRALPRHLRRRGAPGPGRGDRRGPPRPAHRGVVGDHRLLGDAAARRAEDRAERGRGAARRRPPLRRFRFTIAHEIGHWVCHCLEAPSALEPSYCRPVDLTEAADRTLEREANVFAAELLMPEPAVRRRGRSWATSPPAPPASTSRRPRCSGGSTAST